MSSTQGPDAEPARPRGGEDRARPKIDPRLIQEQAGLAGFVAAYRRRIAQGEIGPLPVIVALIAIGTIFQLTSKGVFLTSFNLVNLTFQMAAVGTIAIGVVLILLLGEIDLTAGIVSGLCAAVMAVLSVKHGYSAPAALAAGTLVGAAVGLFQGFWYTWFGIPSFVVTLAGLSMWGGLLLYVLGPTGTINLKDPTITKLASTFFSGATAYGLAAAFLAYVAVGPILAYRKRRAAGLVVPPVAFLVIRSAVAAALVLGAVVKLDRDRGLPSSLVIFVGLVVVIDFMLQRTRFGRMIYAAGGNAEAARRAGIPVQRVRVRDTEPHCDEVYGLSAKTIKCGERDRFCNLPIFAELFYIICPPRMFPGHRVARRRGCGDAARRRLSARAAGLGGHVGLGRVRDVLANLALHYGEPRYRIAPRIARRA